MTEELVIEQEDTTALENADVEQAASLETQDAEEATEVEIVLSGDDESQEQPDKQAFINARLQKRRDKLVAENEQLKTELEQKPAIVPNKVPDRYDFDTEEEYQQASTAHVTALVAEQIRQAQGNQANANAANQQRERLTKAMTSHYERAAALKVKDYEACEDAVIELLGEEQTRGAILAAGKESAQLIAYWGANPGKLQSFIARGNDPSFVATAEVGRLCSQLQARPKQSKAPPPEGKVDGGGVATNNSWTAQLKAAYASNDPVGAYRELAKQAQAAGVNLRDYDTDD